MLGGAQILMAAAAGFEQGYLAVITPARLLAAGELEGIGDVGIGDNAAGKRLADIAGMGGCREAGVDEDARSAHRLVIGLAHLLAKTADEVEVMARLQPAP